MKLLRNLAVLMALLLGMAMPLHAEQLDYIDLNHPASLKFEVHTPDGQPVPGGTIAIRRVADIQPDGDGWQFIPVSDFAPSVSVERLNSSWDTLEQNHNLARMLEEYAIQNGIAGQSETVPASGIVDFSTSAHDISIGLYLVSQPEAAPGYETMPPFLISLPQALYDQNGAFLYYEYDVQASPKSDPKRLRDPQPPARPATPGTSAQTGWAPFAGLALLSLLFLVLLVCGRKKKTGA